MPEGTDIRGADRKSVAVIGAGISGLVCAYELKKAGFEVTVFEKEAQVGGRMACRTDKGLPFDAGANFFVQNYAATHAYCGEFGILDRCLPMEAGLSCGFRGGKLHEITAVPSRLLVKNGNLPLRSRLRMAAWFLKERLAVRRLDFYDLSGTTAYDTENAYDYVARMAGRDVADHVIDAFTAAYQFHGAKEISLAAMLALLDMLMSDNAGFVMCHTSGGMAALPDALAARLTVLRGCAAAKVFSEGGCVLLASSRGVSRFDEFDAAVLATTADAARRIYANPTRRQEEFLARVKYAATINVSFLVPRSILKDLGLAMIPAVESAKISEYTDEARKGCELVKDGKTLLNVGLHDGYARGVMKEDDANIFTAVKEELLKVCPLLDRHGENVENYDLQRWPAAMPKFYPGYLTATKAFLENGQGDNRVFFCGDYLNSPWVEGSVRCGRRVAMKVAAALG